MGVRGYCNSIDCKIVETKTPRDPKERCSTESGKGMKGRSSRGDWIREERVGSMTLSEGGRGRWCWRLRTGSVTDFFEGFT